MEVLTRGLCGIAAHTSSRARLPVIHFVSSGMVYLK
jgi:hypothetical protein